MGLVFLTLVVPLCAACAAPASQGTPSDDPSRADAATEDGDRADREQTDTSPGGDMDVSPDGESVADRPDADDEPDVSPDGESVTDRPDADDRDAVQADQADTDAPADAGFTCTPGTRDCLDNIWYLCGSDGRSRTEEMECPLACDPVQGCVPCRPGSRRCQGTVSMICSPEGDRWIHGRDCAEWGSSCGANGFCSDACGRAEETNSYVGCEYWPVALANGREFDPALFDYRVVVGNPNPLRANVRVFRGGAEVASASVPPGGLSEIVLPWIDGQSFPIAPAGTGWNSMIVADGAYRLTSDVPVTVTQFNPFEYQAGGRFSYSNDASLLLPAHVLTGDYVGLSYVSLSMTTAANDPRLNRPLRYPGYVAIVGIYPGSTRVEISITAEVAAEVSGRFGTTPAGGRISFVLRQGEVAHVMTTITPPCAPGRPGYSRGPLCIMNEHGQSVCHPSLFFDSCIESAFDLTGSRIRADYPVAVFGGNTCTYVPPNKQACDHLEEQLLPIQTWGTTYISAPLSDVRRNDHNIVRVVAAFDNTQVTIDPPASGVSGGVLNAGQWLEFVATAPFSVRGTMAIMVGQYLLGQYYPNPVAPRGDPAMVVLAPVEQYRTATRSSIPRRTTRAPTVRPSFW